MKNQLIITRSIQTILFAYPVLLLTVKGGVGTSFILLVALSIYLLLSTGRENIRQELDRDFVLFGVSMSATIISILLSQLYHMEANARDFDSASRFLFAIPIFLVLRNAEVKAFSVLQYGLPLGAILIGILIGMSGQTMNARGSFTIHIHTGDLALMLGFLSIFSINWVQKDSRIIFALKALGLIAGLFVSLVSSARGGWAAIPVFFLVWTLMSAKFKGDVIVRLSAALVVIVLGGVLSYYALDMVHMRVDAAINDLTSTDPNTSLGVRFQLWGAATQLFMQNPVFGVGAEGFGLAMDRLAASGVITNVAAEIGKGEVHSYYFATLARFGLIGAIAAVLLFIIPIWMFYKATKSQHQFHKVAARMGLCLVSGFLIFCVTVEMFNLKMIATFYGMTVAVLLAAATNRTVGKAAD